jgi:hypothetical protein
VCRLLKGGKYWWYEFIFAGRPIQNQAALKRLRGRPNSNDARNWNRDLTALGAERNRKVVCSGIVRWNISRATLSAVGARLADYATGHLFASVGSRMLVDADANASKKPKCPSEAEGGFEDHQ